QDHSVYKKVGNDIHVELPISYADAVLGANIKFRWIDGKDIDVFIQPGAECGSQKVLPGLGFQNGNLIFHIKIQIPKQLSKKQQKLIEELRKLEHEEDNKSIFSIVKNMLQK
ncbi:MAG TPA: molecular chaperone DnaJ, partial [Hydrogenobaculum sp.]|nr:molecular chaperone DnaJ [Hydrogenobaculum sp.]